MVRWALLGLVGAAAAGSIAWTVFENGEETAVVIPYTDSEAVALGKRVYDEACASCHGAELEGQKNWRQRLPNGRMPAPPHDESGHTWHHVDQQLFELTKYGVEPFAPDGYESDMPGFKDILSDEEILASLAYIKSTWPPSVQKRHDSMRQPRG